MNSAARLHFSFVLARAITPNPAVPSQQCPACHLMLAIYPAFAVRPPGASRPFFQKRQSPPHLRHPTVTTPHAFTAIAQIRHDLLPPPQSRLSTHLPHPLKSRRPASPSRTAHSAHSATCAAPPASASPRTHPLLPHPLLRPGILLLPASTSPHTHCKFAPAWGISSACKNLAPQLPVPATRRAL